MSGWLATLAQEKSWVGTTPPWPFEGNISLVNYHLLGQFGQNMSFFVKMVKLGLFGFKITSSKILRETKIFILFKLSKKLFSFITVTLINNVINGVDLVKIGHFR